MWDDHILLREISDVLFALSMLAMLYGAGWYAVHQPGLFPLHTVRLEANPLRVDVPAVFRTVRGEVNGNFFTTDIERLRLALEKLPWVRSVAIRREFPDRLMVRLEEHQPLARWNDSALVNRQGEVFSAESGQLLPDFVGQEGTSTEVAQSFGQFSRQLAALDLQIERLALTPRHAWQVQLNNGLVLELGREEMQRRLARFVAVYPYGIAAMQGNIRYVDLRYRNGFAVGGSGKG
ncbi:MAG: cell division protein FtsQ/DivIB [Nitrosomonadales bacterium]|nr:cell division protein FtsQ/DivIB [Nitrosomonadales bacterium]